MIGSRAAFAQRFRNRVLLPAALVLLAMLSINGVGLLSARLEVDAIAAEGQTWEARRAIGRVLDEVALAQEAANSCVRCAASALSEEPDIALLAEQIGIPLGDLHKLHETFVIDDRDRIVYARVDGRDSAGSQFQSRLAGGLAAAIDVVRGRQARPVNYNSRLPGQPLPGLSTVMTTRGAVHQTDLALVAGRPAIISVFQMHRSVRSPDRLPPLMVGVRYLDAEWLRDLSRRNFIASPRLSDSNAAAGDEQALAIMTSQNKTLVWLVWKPILPGSMLMARLRAPAAISVALFCLLLAFMAWRVRGFMLRDERQMTQLRTTHRELLASEARAHDLAYRDALTGLPNRTLFNEAADMALRQVTDKEPMAILLLDLDRFKHVNDRFGHLAGDALIEEVARRLCALAGDAEMVARLGGDEFAVLLRFDPAKPIEGRLQAIVDAMRRPFDVVGHQAHVGISIGVALTPVCGTDRTEAMRKADIALYRAKSEGRDCYRFFTDSMDETVQLRATIEADLRTALTTGDGLEVLYQPQVDGMTLQTRGVEALLRWQHPVHGTISPAHFVPIAEETGLVGQLGDLVLSDACRLARLRPELTVAINLSAVQFREEGLPGRIANRLADFGVPPARIELEVTESVLLDDSDIVRSALRELRALGFSIALDDFGTGYSSLGYLRRFEVDRIKIDRSFVKRLGDSRDAGAIVTAVITLGHALGLEVTAEGVETAEQEDFLRQAGCNQLQGFRFARPMRAEDLPVPGSDPCRHAA